MTAGAPSLNGTTSIPPELSSEIKSKIENMLEGAGMCSSLGLAQVNKGYTYAETREMGGRMARDQLKMKLPEFSARTSKIGKTSSGMLPGNTAPPTMPFGSERTFRGECAYRVLGGW